MNNSSRYRAIRVLGAGGFGEVLCAEHTGALGFRRTVALKRMLSADASAAEVARFAQEARLGGLMRHRNLVATYDFERDEAGWLLVMEYVEGRTVADLLRDREQAKVAWEEDLALEIVAQAADGLQYAHGLRGANGQPMGFVHRDIKPSNLMISEEGLIKVLDHGVASTQTTQGAGRAGTPTWMAPEQAQGAVDGRADVYGLGRVLDALLGAAPRPASRAVVQRAVAMNPADRWPDAATFAAAARAAQAGPVGLHALAALVRSATRGPTRTRSSAEPTLTDRSELPRTLLVAARAPMPGALEVLDPANGWLVSVVGAPPPVTPGAAIVLGRVDAGGALGFGPDVDRAVALAVATPQGCCTAEREAWTFAEGALEMVRAGRFRLTTGDVVDVQIRGAGPAEHEINAVPVGAQGPFIGLQPLSASTGDPLFGRDREVQRLCDQLQQGGFVLLTGTSGVGKSSLARAGVAKRYADRATVVRPSSDFLHALARVEEDGPAPRLVVVDQAEELVTVVSHEVRAAMVARLVALAAARVAVLVIVREDFFARVATLPGWADQVAQKVEVLGAPSEAQLHDALERGLGEWGYRCEDDDLGREIARALTSKPAAFAFLQVCGAMLWSQRDPVARVVRRSALPQGVEGVIGSYAEQVVAELPALMQGAVRRLFLRLTTAEGTRRPVEFADACEAAGLATGGAALVDRLVDSRLLSVAEGADGSTQVEVSHEAILSQWPRLQTWRGEDAALALWTDSLRAATRAWVEAGRGEVGLWGPDALTRAATLQHTPTASERAFLDTSRSVAQRGARLRVGLAIAVMVSLTVATAVAVRSRDSALAARDQATAAARRSAHAAALAQATLDNARGRPDLAASAALRLIRDDADDRAGWRALMAAVGGRREEVVLSGHRKGLRTAAISADGARIATASSDGTARVWSAMGQLLEEHPLCDDAHSVSWSVQGALAVRCGTRALWIVPQRGEAVLVPHGEHLISEAWSPDGAQLAFCDGQGALVVDVQGKPRRSITRAEACADLTWTASGDLLAAWPEDVIRLRHGRSTPDPALPHGGHRVRAGAADTLLLATYGGPTSVVDMSSQVAWRTRCATQAPFSSISVQRQVAACDPTSGAYAAILEPDLQAAIGLSALTQPVFSSAWSPDGRSLATGGAEGEVALWTSAGELVSRGLDHGSGQVSFAGWFPDGRSYLTASEDGTARVWPGDGHSRGAWRLDAPVATTTPDGIGGAWVLTSLHRVHHLDASGAEIGTCSIPDGVTGVAAASADRWAAAGEDAVFTLHDGWEVNTFPISARALAWSGEGHLLASDAQGLHALDPEGSHRLLLAGAALVGRLGAADAFVVRTADRATFVVDAQGTPEARPPLDVAFLANGVCSSTDRIALFSGEGDVALLDARGAVVARLPHPAARIAACAFSPDGQRLLTASWAGSARLWDQDGQLLTTLSEHDREVGGVSWSADGTMFTTMGWDARIVVHDRDGGVRYVLDAHHGELATAIWRGDGWLMTAAKDDNTLRSWPVRDADLLAFAAAWAPAAVPGPPE